MGSTRGSGAAGKRGSIPVRSDPHHDPSTNEVSEVPVPGVIPRFEIPCWADRYGVIAGITGRGSESGRGFDLGLWTEEPVKEVMSRWLGFRRAMNGFGAVALGNQVHGVELMKLDSGQGWIYLDGIDGWISTTPGILLAVTIADCVPVYLVAPGRGVALLHAGWRGTAGGILGRGINHLSETTKLAPSEIVMHCGVGICGDCYEVGSEVMQGCGVPAPGRGPWHLDLRSTLVQQAEELGLTHITRSSWCSAHDNSRFFSHRRSRGQDGRMVAYVGIRPDLPLASNPLPE